MRFIPTWLHGMLDYPMGLLLIALPWIGGFATGGPEQWVPVAIGVGMLGLSAFTVYEAGVVRKIPMSTHLMVDVASGALLAASPWLFGFSEEVMLPHLVLGLAEAGSALMTQTQPGRRLSHTAM